MKSEKAYRTIAEVSELLQVQPSVLRFWETQFVQIKPVRRVGGRRYYRADDVVLLKTIYDLLYKQGYTISGAQKYLKETSSNAKKMKNSDKKKDFVEQMRSVRDYLKDFIA